MENLFASRLKYKDERNELVQGLVKLISNSLYGIQIRKEIYQSFICKSEHWMQTEYNDIVLDYWRLPNGNYILKIRRKMV